MRLDTNQFACDLRFREFYVSLTLVAGEIKLKQPFKVLMLVAKSREEAETVSAKFTRQSGSVLASAHPGLLAAP